jgi:hypothetical protein
MKLLSGSAFGRLCLGLLAMVCVVCSGPPARAAELNGSWKGHWEDFRSGHSGPLNAKFTACGDQYRVRFTGRFAKIVPFAYSVNLTVVGREGDKVLLAGESRLPLFGVFTYTAEGDCCHFEAHFCSRRYQGRFVLHRCGCSN